MFLGCRSGRDRGPSVCWETASGKITGEGYCDKILPNVVERMALSYYKHGYFWFITGKLKY